MYISNKYKIIQNQTLCTNFTAANTTKMKHELTSFKTLLPATQTFNRNNLWNKNV
jgi:hypothetical protein